METRASRIVGGIRDIQPKKKAPTLELFFGREDAGKFPAQNRSPMSIEIDGVVWSGTIGIKPKNPPYFHTGLESKASRSTVTEVLRRLGVKENGRLEFELVAPGKLTLTRVLEHGRWRAGNETGVRALW